MANDTGPAEAKVPLSDRLTPRTPSPEDSTPRSKVYTPQMLEGQYRMFMEGEPGYDPNKPLPEKQRDLFKLYEKGEVKDTNQAWEWFLGRKWDEFDDDEKKLVLENLNPEEREQYGHLYSASIPFVPHEDDLKIVSPGSSRNHRR